VSDETAIRSALAAWQFHTPVRIERLLGGFNSRTWRIAEDIRIGLADPVENRRGLDDAHKAWEQLDR
jgi:hypothetical protein